MQESGQRSLVEFNLHENPIRDSCPDSIQILLGFHVSFIDFPRLICALLILFAHLSHKCTFTCLIINESNITSLNKYSTKIFQWSDYLNRVTILVIRQFNQFIHWLTKYPIICFTFSLPLSILCHSKIWITYTRWDKLSSSLVQNNKARCLFVKFFPNID